MDLNRMFVNLKIEMSKLGLPSLHIETYKDVKKAQNGEYQKSELHSWFIFDMQSSGKRHLCDQ